MGLHDVRRLAIEVVRAQDDALEVLGVVVPSGGSGYIVSSCRFGSASPWAASVT